MNSPWWARIRLPRRRSPRDLSELLRERLAERDAATLAAHERELAHLDRLVQRVAGRIA